jgi:hypothetical protein
MAEQYLACYPVEPCPTCGANKTPGTPKCGRCWNLWQVVETHAAALLADPQRAAPVRELLERVLATKPNPGPEAT